MISPIAIVNLIKRHLKSNDPAILRCLLDLCPQNLDNPNWRWEIKGFVCALRSQQLLSTDAQNEIDTALFGEGKQRAKNRALSRHFSIDVYTLTPRLEARKHQYDIAALNPFDAYAKLAMSYEYNALTDVDVIQVFAERLRDRGSNQQPDQCFNRSSIVQPRG